MSQQPVYLQYFDLENFNGEKSKYRVASLVINRPDSANAFNGDILISLKEKLDEIDQRSDIRALLIQGSGKHFSAGADLNWMKESAQLSYEENVEESNKLTGMYETIQQLSIPTIAVVKGATYGGGVGIVASCDFAIATETARFCLSEVNIGLLPAVVLPYLSRKMECGQLRRNVLGGRVFNMEEAFQYGLIQKQANSKDLNNVISEEVNQLLGASPEAQGSYKRLQRYLSDHSYSQGPYTAAAISIARASDFGQAGLNAFFKKEKAPWCNRLPKDCVLLPE